MDRNHSGDTEAEYMRVALRKESVDRNWSIADTDSLTVLSLSARRAWIEIVWIGAMRWACRSRSPQGERG